MNTNAIGQPLTDTVPGTTPGQITLKRTWPRKPDSSIDWRAVAMEHPEHFYVKGDLKEKAAKLLNKPVESIRDLGPEDIVKLPDWMLVIKKAGILRLARLRGYISAVPDVKNVLRDYVVVQTWIQWDDFDDGQGNVIEGKTTGGVGEATPENTTKMGCAYLAATAENRAFSRAVRQYLEIDIVSSDELGADGVEPEQKSSSTGGGGNVSSVDSGPSIPVGQPAHTLKTHADNARISFDQIKAHALARWTEETPMATANPSYRRTIENDPSTATSWTDIKPRDCLTLVTAIQRAKELETLATAERHSFDAVKKAAQTRYDEDRANKVPAPRIISDPSKWTKWFDIHVKDSMTLIELVKTAKAAREKNRAEKEAAQSAEKPANQEPAPAQVAVQQAAVTPPEPAKSAPKPRKPRKVESITSHPPGSETEQKIAA